jgi:hypothetical protein
LKGNGLLEIRSTGELLLLSNDDSNTIISEIAINNYGNIYVYNYTITWIKYSLLSNYGKIHFIGNQKWLYNNILSSYEKALSRNYERYTDSNVIQGQIFFTNYTIIDCANKCNAKYSESINKVKNNIINTNENYFNCDSFIHNSRLRLCQINTKPLTKQIVSSGSSDGNITNLWFLYIKNEKYIKISRVLNYENGIIHLQSNQFKIFLNLEIFNYGTINVLNNSIVNFGMNFIQYEIGILNIHGALLLHSSVLDGVVNGTGTLIYANMYSNIYDCTHSHCIDNSTNYNTLMTSIVAIDLSVEVSSILNVMSSSMVLRLKRLSLNNGTLNVLEKSLYLNVISLDIMNNGKIRASNNVERLIRNDNYDGKICDIVNDTLNFNFTVNRSYSFSSCYDILVYSTNIRMTHGGILDTSYGMIVGMNIEIGVNSSITSTGRGFGNDNITNMDVHGFERRSPFAGSYGFLGSSGGTYGGLGGWGNNQITKDPSLLAPYTDINKTRAGYGDYASSLLWGTPGKLIHVCIYECNTKVAFRYLGSSIL